MSQQLFNSARSDDYDPTLDGFGGWLILLTISLLISPIYIAYFLNTSLSEIMPLWDILPTEGSSAYIPGFSILYLMEVIGNTFFGLLTLCALYLFFTKKQLFPKFLIYLLIGNLIFLLGELIVAEAILGDILNLNDPENLRDIIASAIRTLILTPYLLKSKRVKSTFRH